MQEIYLDANATTPVLPLAREAALAVMAEEFGNPSSIHSTGLRARALIGRARATARRVLGAPSGQLLFVSGATEGIQTAVLSALSALRGRGDVRWLLYGATEHKAVPEALRHWNRVLGLDLQVRAIPVGRDGRHDLAWLREHAPQAGLVCTMAANNETGVISDLDGIAAALAGSPALWMVDGVQALGKLPLALERRGIDYAPFSGHKLYAPKGVGLLYVREGAPFTPLMAGGGQEGALRSGTENMAGIAALGAVLEALEAGEVFRDAATLAGYRAELLAALQHPFPGLVLNAPAEICLPTTLNFSVPGLSSRLLLDLFDAAGLRVSGGSACSAAQAEPSFVLEAMGLPAWQTASALRLSFGPAAEPAFIAEACRRLRDCAAALRGNCLTPSTDAGGGRPLDGITRYSVAGACCYVLADAASRQAVVIDPLPELTEPLARLLSCQGYTLSALLDTHSHGDHASSAAELRAALPPDLLAPGEVDALGWPLGQERLVLGARSLQRLAVPGHTLDSTAYLLTEADGRVSLAFVGDCVMPGALGRSDFAQSAPLAYAQSLRTLADVVGEQALLLPGHDYDNRLACSLATERAAQPLLAQVLGGDLPADTFATLKAELERSLGLTAYQTMACGARVDAAACESQRAELDAATLRGLLASRPDLRLVDVREPYEQDLGPLAAQFPAHRVESVALSALLNRLTSWRDEAGAGPLVFVCRSGNRSGQVARALRRLGHEQAWSLAGGLALWRPQPQERSAV